MGLAFVLELALNSLCSPGSNTEQSSASVSSMMRLQACTNMFGSQHFKEVLGLGIVVQHFNSSLDYTMRPCLNTHNKPQNNQNPQMQNFQNKPTNKDHLFDLQEFLTCKF